MSEIQVGDAITVQRNIGTGLITHRVTAINEVDGVTEITMKGDANTSEDPTPYRVKTAGLVAVAFIFAFFWDPNKSARKRDEATDQGTDGEPPATEAG
ncbi:hypothetical protein GCM10022198_10800 [Klugiella xanthotipulae]|uniref:hypothetical protein n=1 Tax=Klugiella xanthotipulae TaxID=244735 RepID=UPI0011530728|nr:hypothetical protein [Klugiella xanthotipulae]